MSSGRCTRQHDMTTETLAASTTIGALAEAVFAVLTDPASHPAHRRHGLGAQSAARR
jgi:hypothetical protein